MKAKKAVKKLNELFGFDMDTFIVLGVDKDRKKFQRLVYGDDKVLVQLILNLFEREPKIAEIVFKVSAMKKLNQIVTGESDEED